MKTDGLSLLNGRVRLSRFPQPDIVTVSIPGTPEYMRSLRTLFVSDIHLRRQVSDERLLALMDLMRGTNADMLLLGGDYGEGEKQCERFFHALSNLTFPLGIFAVPGNNDTYDNLEDMARIGGARLLRNTSASVDLPGGKLLIGGSDDFKFGNPRTGDLFPEDGGYRLLLSHYPVRPECSCDLQLSGHTHGGQIVLGKLSPYSIGFERSYGLLGVRGFSQAHGYPVLIGNGIGISRLPLRSWATPEIYILKFEK